MNNSVGGWTVIMSNGLIKYRENFDEKLMKLGLLSQNKHQIDLLTEKFCVFNEALGTYSVYVFVYEILKKYLRRWRRCHQHTWEVFQFAQTFNSLMDFVILTTKELLKNYFNPKLNVVALVYGLNFELKITLIW